MRFAINKKTSCKTGGFLFIAISPSIHLFKSEIIVDQLGLLKQSINSWEMLR
jgi:hypothetical protein